MTNCKATIRTLLVVLFALGLVGCGPGYDVVSVKGRITLDGKPLTNATILTQPIGTKENNTPGPGSFAETDSDGNYELELQVKVNDKVVIGAVPGPSRIKITENAEKKVSSDDSAEVVRSKIPLDYQEGKAEFTFPAEGDDQLDFELKSERRRKRR